ncbi:uncharacterized protein LOC127812005 isoform X2 [Diospyros lotus]|uniref:uncharacterized protein LOC127812005 isoform X2 n=1 Tax=Diospyros lotus TaxID=55363 RepID=UPI00225AA78C|nr:uncharacterized protein LOC127812005 isoform X2 [Diospyros lotus]
MKTTGDTALQAAVSSKPHNLTPESDLPQRVKTQKPPRRRTTDRGYSSAGERLHKEGNRAPAGKRSRPGTPGLRWKFGGGEKCEEISLSEGRQLPAKFAGKSSRKVREAVVSSRKLAAVLWRVQLPGMTVDAGRGSERSTLSEHGRLGFKFEPVVQFSIFAMEGATKWNPACLKASDEVGWIYCHSSKHQRQLSADPTISALEVELARTQACIHKLETEREASKKKLEHFLKNLSEEKATWQSREREKICAVFNDMNADLSQERKTLKRLEIVNSKLVSELADSKLLMKRYMKDYEREWKARELIEEVCYELAEEVREDKAEVEALKRECMKLCEEVEEERKMLQIAEVWREERVHMKFVDAKIALDEKYSQMNKLVADLETFLSSKGAIPDAEEMRKAEFLSRTAISVNIKGCKEFLNELEDFNFDDGRERDIGPCVELSPGILASEVHAMSSKVNMFNKDGKQTHSSAHLDQNGEEEEEDGSGWETVSQPEDQGSSYSLEGSDNPSVIEIHHGGNASGSRAEWEENACNKTPITETREVGRVPKTYLKKALSMPWFSGSGSGPNDGENYRIMSAEGINGGRLSSCSSSISPDGGSSKSRLSSSSDWCSVESGGVKGGTTHERSSKTKLLEGRTKPKNRIEASKHLT